MVGMAKKSDLPDLVGRHLRAKVLGKRHYKIADALMKKLETEMTPGERVTLESGKVFEFRDKGSMFPVGQTARRFEFKEVTVA
jgi:hypothetical protein